MASFGAWFRSQGKSAKSAGNYTQALNSTLTRMAEEHGIHRGDLLDVVDKTAFDSIAVQLKALTEFRELNERGKSMYSAALNNYVKYLEQLDESVEPLPEITASEFSDYQSQVQQNIERSRATDPVNRRKRLAEAASKPKRMTVQTTVYSRNADVIQEALERAEGVYEGCNAPAPFIRASDGTPYLEVHHKVQLSKGGDDTVENAIALCPNCHRKMHFG
jgi:5-methylcytosine-specific restriction endonuclease McrA